MQPDPVQFRAHAVERMCERRVTVDEVLALLHDGKIIEDYSADMPASGQLRMGWAAGRPLHAVFALDPEAHAAVVVTAYEPTLADWDDTFSRRRE